MDWMDGGQIQKARARPCNLRIISVRSPPALVANLRLQATELDAMRKAEEVRLKQVSKEHEELKKEQYK